MDHLFSSPAVQAGLGFNIHCDPPLRNFIIGDEQLLRQVLFNLVGNAVKFTSSGEIHLSATALPVAVNGQTRVLFTVSDTGPGISPEKIGAVFEPFTQEDSSYTRSFQGAGLGLNIVRRIVQLLNGTIAIDSIEHQGATFYLSIPFGRTPSTSTTPINNIAKAQPTTNADALQILVVEDDPINHRTLTALLHKHGIDSIGAFDGKEALALLLENEFDLILMDIQMPILDGVATTKAIRNNPEFKHKANVPIIALTAHAMESDQEKFLSAGMNDYISKPVDIDALLAAIHRVSAQG